MNKLLVALALSAAPAVAHAQLLHCALGPVAACGTFSFRNVGGDPNFINAIAAPGDGFPIYIVSTTPFEFISATIRDGEGLHNPIIIRGFTANEIDEAHGFPFNFPQFAITSAFGGGIIAEPGVDVTTPMVDWVGVSAISFDAAGGLDANFPQTGTIDFNFAITSISVTASPEPSTIALFGTGLLGIVGAAVRRRRAA